jgi:CubicO group peptidase (beta-lactamase class C family)
MIIEKLSNLSFAQYLDKNIFIPLAMSNSVAFENGISKVKNRAYGYKFEKDSIIFKDQSLTSAVLGDGGIYTSVNDLYMWAQALYTNKLISTKTLYQAFSNGHLVNGDKFDYGFGWRLSEYKGLKSVYHTGSTCGFRNVLFRIPDKKLTIIVLTNRAEPDLKILAEKLARLFLF